MPQSHKGVVLARLICSSQASLDIALYGGPLSETQTEGATTISNFAGCHSQKLRQEKPLGPSGNYMFSSKHESHHFPTPIIQWPELIKFSPLCIQRKEMDAVEHT